MSEIEEARDRAQKALASLMEIADCARIFLSVHDGETGSTKHLTIGAGNWFGQEGQIREWCMQNEERSRAEVHEEDEE